MDADAKNERLIASDGAPPHPETGHKRKRVDDRLQVKRIHVIGDVFLDNVNICDDFQFGKDNLGEIMHLPGGSALNTACHMATHSKGMTDEVEVTLFSVIGKDAEGHMCLKRLEECGVKTEFVKQHPTRRTGICTVISTSGKDGRTAERGFITSRGAVGHLTVDSFDWDALVECDHLHIAGFYNLPAIFQVESNFLQLKKLVETLSKKGVTSTVNPQWDSSGRFSNILRLPVDAIVMNIDEARMIMHNNGAPKLNLRGADDLYAPMEAIVLPHIPMAVVTLGADGMALIEKGSILRMGAPKLEAIDTTGGGDAASAGFVLGFSQRELRKCQTSQEKYDAKLHWMKMGVLAGSEACRHIGGSVSDPVDFHKDGGESRAGNIS